jgi:uncharacterized YigZ family protein
VSDLTQQQNIPAADWRSPAGSGRAEIKVRGSRFLAEVAPVTEMAEVSDHLARLRQEFPRATHHCWGWRLRQEGVLTERSADAGEPAGSAGAPILRALAAAEVENASAVVVRWFGGTKLGVGPLARAYRDAAAAALAAAGIERRRHLRQVRVTFPHDMSSEVRRALGRAGARVLAEEHGASATVVTAVAPDRVPALRAGVGDASRGRAEIVEEGLLVVRVSG